MDRAITAMIMDALEFSQQETDEDEEAMVNEVSDVRSFQAAEVMTTDAGFVITLKDGSEFQVTVKRSR